VYGDVEAETPAAVLNEFIGQDGAYIALHAYLTPNEQTSDALEDLQAALRDATGLAVTAGYGPRFLHSTGQLHKGDAGDGLFIQLTAEMPEDIDIPDEPDSSESAMSFGTLKEAQALGDRQALLDAGREVLRFRFANTRSGLEALTDALPGKRA
jgi:glucose-6-phosphate isomerase/transaldolase/glucose-6-phosphate isomerase